MSDATVEADSKVRLVVRDDCQELRRPQQHPHNLFVRLSPEVAWDLQNQILSSPSSFGCYGRQEDDEEEEIVDHDSCWVLLDAQDGTTSTPSVDFLPLRITINDRDDHNGELSHTIYASFNGGTIRCDDNIGTIEMPLSLLPKGKLRENAPDFVSLQALSRIEYATRVEVEPLTTEDWELLEIHSEAMEYGGLLNQVSVVYPMQFLGFRVGRSGDEVKIVVKEIQTAATATETTVWPRSLATPGENCDSACEIVNCALLVQNTEVVVIPKARSAKKALSWSNPLRLLPSDEDWGESLSTLNSISYVESCKVEPYSVLVNPREWPFENKWARIKPATSKNPEQLVRVATSQSVPISNLGTSNVLELRRESFDQRRKVFFVHDEKVTSYPEYDDLHLFPIDTPENILYSATRLDMKLLYFFDRVQIKPHSPNVVGIGGIKFEVVRLVEGPRKVVPSWNVPDITLSSPIVPLMGSDDEVTSETSISSPVGALIPSGCLSPHSHGNDFLRIVSKNQDQCLKRFVVSYDRCDLERAWEDCQNRADPLELISGEFLTIRCPRENVGSGNWIVPVVERMKAFSSVVVKLFGFTGSGKSHSALLLASFASLWLNRPILYLDCKKLQKSSPKMAGILGEVDAVFRRSQEVGNAIIILDDLDSLSPNLLGTDESTSSAKMHNANPAAVDQSKVVADRIFHMFEASTRNGVSLVVTSASSESINPLLFRNLTVLLVPVKVPVLSSQNQVDLLKSFVELHGRHMRTSPDFESHLSRRLSGFLPRDLEKMSFRFARCCQTISDKDLSQGILEEVLDTFTPLAQMRASNRSRSSRALGWKDIGGLFEVKEKLESVVRNPILYRRIYERSKIRLPRGMLLFGPPGCGKSCIVPALARECNYPIVKVRGPEIFDKYIGASEAKVREVFERATQMAPSILFLDELEALAPRRGSDSTGVTDRVVNQLLTFLDGVEDVSKGTVYVVGATSRPDKVDPAVIRPGRLEQHLFLGPPENKTEWIDLLSRVSKQWNLSGNCSSALSNGTLFDSIKDLSRLSPADVRAAFDTAHLQAVHRKLAMSPASEIIAIELELDDLKFAFQETKPSLNLAEGRLLDNVYKPFRGKLSHYARKELDGTSPLKTTFR